MQHLTFAHRHLFAANEEPERSLQNVGHLLALVRVIRHDAAALEIDLRDHLPLAGDDLSRQHFRHFFERNFVPPMQANRLDAHGVRSIYQRSRVL